MPPAIKSTMVDQAIVPKLKFKDIDCLQATESDEWSSNNNGIYKAGLFEGSNALLVFAKIDRCRGTIKPDI
jgi:hypothetical protein